MKKGWKTSCGVIKNEEGESDKKPGNIKYHVHLLNSFGELHTLGEMDWNNLGFQYYCPCESLILCRICSLTHKLRTTIYISRYSKKITYSTVWVFMFGHMSFKFKSTQRKLSLLMGSSSSGVFPLMRHGRHLASPFCTACCVRLLFS